MIFFRENKDDHLAEIKSSIINLAFKWLLIFLIPGTVIIFFRIKVLGLQPVMIFVFISTIIISLIYFYRRKVSYIVRGVVYSGFFLILGLLALRDYGIFANNIAWFFMSAIFAALVINKKVSFWFLAIGLIGLFIYLFLFINEHITYKIDVIEYANSPFFWIAAVVTTSFVTLTVVFSSHSMNKFLIKKQEELIKSNTDLIASNQKLKEEIESHKKTEQELFKSEEWFKSLFLLAGDAAFIFHGDRIIECNQRAIELLGWAKEDIINKHPWDLSPTLQPDGGNSREKAEEIISSMLKNKTPFYFEWQNIKINGDIVDVNAYLSILPYEKEMFLAVVRDITNEKKARQALINSERKFRNIFNSVTDAIMIYDSSNKIIEANDVACMLMGYTREELLKLETPDLLDGEYLEGYKKNVKSIIDIKADVYELEMKTKNNKLISVESNVKRIIFDDEIVLITVIRDISIRKQHQRDIYAAMVDAEEKERARYAKELHDGLGPLLSTCKIYFHTLNFISDIEKRKKHINRATELLEDALVSIKEISNNLSPHILKNYGLKEALLSFIEKLRNITNTKFSIVSDLNYRLPEIIEFTLYRTLIELINNSVKYSKADLIQVEVKEQERNVQIKYSDNGMGFDYKQVKSKAFGFGLINMENRIKEIGGEYNFNSSPGKGVTVQILIKEPM